MWAFDITVELDSVLLCLASDSKVNLELCGVFKNGLCVIATLSINVEWQSLVHRDDKDFPLRVSFYVLSAPAANTKP